MAERIDLWHPAGDDDRGLVPAGLGEDGLDGDDGHLPSADADLGFLDGAAQTYPHWLYLLTYGDRWKVNNSTMFDYSRRAYIEGSVTRLADIVTERVGFSEDNVGLDLAAGSEAQALRDLLDSGILGRALATNFRDHMPRDLRRGDLDHVEGNLTSRSTWQQILAWRRRNAPEGFDLVMHRPVGGLQDLELDTYQAAARVLFGMVKPGGMMFSQVPRPVMDTDGGLRELCRTVREGGDVEDVVTTGQRIRRLHKDESDFYAVVFKSY